jgi:serine/threonine protein kinase
MQIDRILANRYQICKQLSQKAGRRTLLAKDLQSQDLVIIKILRFDPDFQWDDLKLFEREANTLKNVSHPAIPNYLDYFEIDESDTRGFALVQTYIDAPSLETIVQQGRKFSESEVIELADRILSILIYLHEQIPPVIHRDLKPSNILLSNRSGNSIGDVYLVDFGSVQTVASKEGSTITIVGSYGYIPLEQFGGQTTTASDLYSLGMTVIYLLTGTHPSELPQINGQVKFTTEISTRFRKWVEKITQPYLDKRFNLARSAQSALQSEDGIHEDFRHLKPANTRVRLERDRDTMRIIFRDRNLTESLLLNSFDPLFAYAILLWMLGCIIAVFLATYFPYFASYIGVVWLTIFVTIVSRGSMRKILLLIRRIKRKISPISNELTIDSHRIAKSKLVGRSGKLKIAIATHERSQITLLAYNPGYVFDGYSNSKGDLLYDKSVTIAPELYIYAGSKKYSISDGLSQAELWWLGQELGDFLDLKLEMIYPFPQLGK